MLAHALAAPSLDFSTLPVRRTVPPPELLREHELGGHTWAVALPVTFTPFASAQPCSARCVFCSETLWPRDSQRLESTDVPEWLLGVLEAHGLYRSGVIHKFVFHANGNLCADWDPEREVLLRTA